jgi:hypothetical protein
MMNINDRMIFTLNWDRKPISLQNQGEKGKLKILERSKEERP